MYKNDEPTKVPEGSVSKTAERAPIGSKSSFFGNRWYHASSLIVRRIEREIRFVSPLEYDHTESGSPAGAAAATPARKEEAIPMLEVAAVRLKDEGEQAAEAGAGP